MIEMHVYIIYSNPMTFRPFLEFSVPNFGHLPKNASHFAKSRQKLTETLRDHAEQEEEANVNKGGV